MHVPIIPREPIYVNVDADVITCDEHDVEIDQVIMNYAISVAQNAYFLSEQSLPLRHVIKPCNL